MYHPQVIAESIAKTEQANHIKLVDYSPVQVDQIRSHLESNYSPEGPKRSWLPWETEFVRNEILMSQCNFRHWAECYWTITLDGGGTGRLNLAPSQIVALDRHIAPVELDVHEAAKRGEPVEGLLFYWHKARQMYATALCRALMMHRMTCFSDARGLSASVDEDKIQELYDRDKMGFESLPFYLKPQLIYDVKSAHIQFSTSGRMLYQIGTQKSGMGQGRQFDVLHLTECAFWESPEYHIDYVLKPAIPRSRFTLAIGESSGNGRGNWWHSETEDARSGRSKWKYIFIPYYAIPAKYRAVPPTNWHPSALTLAHAKMVSDSSAEFTGQRIDLSLDQLYWYEKEREEYQRKGRLSIFLTNFCATPEESFQHLQDSAFAPELLEKIRLGTSVPAGLEVMIN